MTRFTAVLISVCFFIISSYAYSSSINLADIDLKYSEIFLTPDEFKTLPPVDQLNYLMAISFLSSVNQNLYAPNLYVSAPVEKPELNFSERKLNLFLRAVVNEADAFGPLIVGAGRLLISAPVRTQLMRAGVALANGAKKVASIVTSRVTTRSLVAIGNTIKKEMAAVTKLLKKQSELNKNPVKNAKALESLKIKISAARDQLNASKFNFRVQGGTNAQLLAIENGAATSIGYKVESAILMATGIGGFALLDHFLFPDEDDKKSPAKPESEKPKTETLTVMPPKMESGEPCLYGLHPSQYSIEKKILTCLRPKESINPLCTKNQFMCPEFNFQLDGKALAKEFCLSHLPKENLGQRCLTRLQEIFKKIAYGEGKELVWDVEAVEKFVRQLHLTKYNLESDYYFPKNASRSGLKIKQYCSAKVVKNNRNQQAECAAIEAFLVSTLNTKASEIAFHRSPSSLTEIDSRPPQPQNK